MTSEKLRQARTFEETYLPVIPAEVRPAFHITGGVGWINDPNGFSVYKGEYHLFFQYHPYSLDWGPMHWGHVKTKDFIRWERLPIALAPDAPFDQDGRFSGSAIELPDGRQLLMYTGVRRVRREDSVIQDIQHQCVAVGNGIDYEKYDGNPVLDASDLPEGASKQDFRDPKIWRQGDTYYAVVGNRPADGSGSILLFKSADGFHWHYDCVIDACYHEYGKMWECPDFFPLDGKQLLLVSPQEMTPLGLEFHAGYGTLCLMGSYDPLTHQFDRERVQAIDYGIDFYAPQTLETPDGRRVMIAWMQNWATANCKPQGVQWFGSMTLPRELAVKNGRLIQNPVRELERYHGHRVSYTDVLVTDEVNLHGVTGRILDMTVQVRPLSSDAPYRHFKINLAKDGEHVTTVRYKPENSTIRIDRTRCGGRFDIVHVRDFLVTPKHGEVKLRLVLDRNSLELFVNDGEQAATVLLYAPQTASSISFEAEGGAVISVEKYDLNLGQEDA
jgi:beta-fructofuranosidase